MSNGPETKAGEVVRDKADSEEKPLPKSVALFESEIDVSTCNVANEFDQPCGEQVADHCWVDQKKLCSSHAQKDAATGLAYCSLAHASRAEDANNFPGFVSL